MRRDQKNGGGRKVKDKKSLVRHSGVPRASWGPGTMDSPPWWRRAYVLPARQLATSHTRHIATWTPSRPVTTIFHEFSLSRQTPSPDPNPPPECRQSTCLPELPSYHHACAVLTKLHRCPPCHTPKQHVKPRNETASNAKPQLAGHSFPATS